MGSEWSIRTYRKGDEQGILELTEAVHGFVPDKVAWMKWWQWLYKHCPTGEAIIWIVESDGKIIGHRAAIPMAFKVNDNRIASTLGVEAMVHPDYQGMGIFTALAREMLDQMARTDIAFSIGFPNDRSYTLSINQLGFIEPCPLKIMILPLNLENILGRFITFKFLAKIVSKIAKPFFNLIFRTKKSPRIENLLIKEVSLFDDRFDDFWDRISADYGIIGMRNKEYLNWRYVNTPDTKYTIYVAEQNNKILGYTVLRYGQTRNVVSGYIFDLVAQKAQQDVIHCLINRAVEYFKQQNVDLVLNFMIGPEEYYSLYRKNGFFSPSFLSRKWRFLLRIINPRAPATEQYLKDGNNWFIQIGDADEDLSEIRHP